MKKLLSIVALFFLSGCITYSLEELRQVTPKGTPFQQALSAHYRSYAESEEQQYDWFDSAYFADKGLQVAYGKDMPPEDPADWDIGPEALPVIQTAYNTLKEVLAAGAATTQPEVAARAQYFFDCWIEQQEEGWQVDDIAYCRDGFKDAMDLLLGSNAAMLLGETHEVAKQETPVMEPMQPTPMAAEPVEPDDSMPVAEEMPSAGKVPAELAMPKKPQVDSYIVFFKEKESDMSQSGEDTIHEVLKKVKSGQKLQFVLNAYTDTVGDSEANLKLSETRAQAVREALIAGGVDPENIRLYAFGESDTPVRTPDNTGEPANQRVEIFISE